MSHVRILKQEYESSGRLLRVAAVDDSLKQKLKYKACKIEWLLVRHTANLSGSDLKILFKLLANNSSVRCLDLRSAFRTEEFKNNDALKIDVIKALASLLIVNPFINLMNLGFNSLPLEAMNCLVQALNFYKGKKEPVMRWIALRKGHFGGIEGVKSIIKSQLDNRYLEFLELQGAIKISDLKSDDGMPNAEAVELMKLYSHPGMDAKLKFDDEIREYLVKLQNEAEKNHRVSPRRIYKEPSPRKVSLESPRFFSFGQTKSKSLPPLLVSSSSKVVIAAGLEKARLVLTAENGSERSSQNLKRK